MMGKGQQPGGESQRLAAESERDVESAIATQDTAKATEALQKAGDAELAAAYTYLRQAVGIIAFLLPGTLVLGNAVFSDGPVLLGSISAYYYSPMGNVFVGALCALAVFFLSYQYRPMKNYEPDNLYSKCASVAAIGVAIFPTLSDTVAPGRGERIVSTIHLTSAFSLFALLAFFSLKLFTQTGGAISEEKRKRNRVYRTCGWTIVGALALAGLTMVVEPPASWHAFWALETVCVEAFGVSWLVKGGFRKILADKPMP